MRDRNIIDRGRPVWRYIIDPNEVLREQGKGRVANLHKTVHHDGMDGSGKCRDHVKSQWYQSRWGDLFRIRPDQDTKGRFANDKTGFRLAISVEVEATGARADYLVTDDPIKIDEGTARRSGRTSTAGGTKL